MEAAQEGHVEIVKFLIERGANIHAETGTQDTALTYASANGHTIISDILIQCGAQLVRGVDTHTHKQSNKHKHTLSLSLSLSILSALSNTYSTHSNSLMYLLHISQTLTHTLCRSMSVRVEGHLS